MLRKLINDFYVPARLLRGESKNERSLTDLLHISELLQQASEVCDGEQALIRHLALERANSSISNDAQQLRLESDANLLKIVTIHKSKGLEYPIVFMPYACSYRKTKSDDMPLKWHDESGRLRISLVSNASIIEQIEKERLAEDIRKFYVGITRAQFACWVGTADIDGFPDSAIHSLLGSNLNDGLTQLQPLESKGVIAFEENPAHSTKPVLLRVDAWEDLTFCQSNRTINEGWWIASYSSLQKLAINSPVAVDNHRQSQSVKFEENFSLINEIAKSDDLVLTDGSQQYSPADTYDEDVFNETVLSDTHRLKAQLVSDQLTSSKNINQPNNENSLHDFAKGAEIGTLLHSVLEQIADFGFSDCAVDELWIKQTVTKTFRLYFQSKSLNVSQQNTLIDKLSQWTSRFLEMPISVENYSPQVDTVFKLSELKTYSSEMEFWIGVPKTPLSEIDRLICAHTLQGSPRPKLTHGQLHGVLKGFIDLVAQVNGKYYILDYKSNWLGPSDEYYSNERMGELILSERYDLQYVIYLLALHRLLTVRLPEYDYDQHIGGAIYLFLRGESASSKGVYFERPPKELILSIDSLLNRKSQESVL
jgi:exodeoxyribonuclease V beta subunit